MPSSLPLSAYSVTVTKGSYILHACNTEQVRYNSIVYIGIAVNSHIIQFQIVYFHIEVVPIHDDIFIPGLSPSKPAHTIPTSVLQISQYTYNK